MVHWAKKEISWEEWPRAFSPGDPTPRPKGLGVSGQHSPSRSCRGRPRAYLRPGRAQAHIDRAGPSCRAQKDWLSMAHRVDATVAMPGHGPGHSRAKPGGPWAEKFKKKYVEK